MESQNKVIAASARTDVGDRHEPPRLHARVELLGRQHVFSKRAVDAPHQPLGLARV
jgi:hypothetical protein